MFTYDPEENSQMPFPFTFAETKFSANSIWRQYFHLLSEVLELGWEILMGRWQPAAREAVDVRCSGETLLRILRKKGADLEAAREDVVAGHIERGYYQ